MNKNIIKYKINNEDYRITFFSDKDAADITEDLNRLASDKKMLLVIDSNINKKILSPLFQDLSRSGFSIRIMYVDGSKKNKNLKLMLKILDKLISNGFTKRSVVLSCGGGVIGDVTALASSLYLRGTIYYHIPTTMTSMVDSCIGGKTGINYKGLINSVGNYYHPKNVFISKNIINLLPKREFFAGIPEIVKIGFIYNKKILNLVENNFNKIIKRDFTFLVKIISLTLKAKIKFFRNDIYEKSTRLKLNFGHTFAHSIEMSIKSKDDEVLRHGEAVGLGMLCELYYHDGFSKKYQHLKKVLKKFNLPIQLNKFVKKEKKDFIKNQIYKFLFLDKKKITIYPRFIQINSYGNAVIKEMKNNAKILKTIDEVLFK
jgi:3-dehydroquinate synthase